MAVVAMDGGGMVVSLYLHVPPTGRPPHHSGPDCASGPGRVAGGGGLVKVVGGPSLFNGVRDMQAAPLEVDNPIVAHCSSKQFGSALDRPGWCYGEEGGTALEGTGGRATTDWDGVGCEMEEPT